MPVKKENGEMSAFERRRLENIAANNAILKDISATAAKVLPPPSKPPSASHSKRSSAPRRREPPVKREPARPTRQSLRLASVAADDEVLKRKFEVEAEHEAEKARAKKMRVSGDLSLGDIVVEGRKWESGVDGMAGLQGLALRGAMPGVRTFTDEDVKDTGDVGLKELRLRMSGLKLYEQWSPNDIKITPQRVYALGFHPTEDKPIVFAGDKEGAMGVFDASQEAVKIEAGDDDDDDGDAEDDYLDPVISAFKTHSRTISSFFFSRVDANTVYSASYDSSIRRLDLAKGVSAEVFAPTDADEDLPISAIDVPHTDPNVILFSTLQGSLGRHDTRTPASEAEIWTLTEQKIGGFSLHPRHPHLLATASLDRTLKIWDLRRMAGKGALRHPALLGAHESRLSVSHASWSAGGHVATSSYDDTIKIYDLSGAGGWAEGCDISDEAMQPAHRVPHNNQTGRWVTILKPQWQASPADGIHKFVIGNMNRFVDVYAADGEQLAQLGGDGITAVPAAAHLHPTKDWVAGGNASGKLCLWL